MRLCFSSFVLGCLFTAPLFSQASQNFFYKDSLLFSIDSVSYFKSDYDALSVAIKVYSCMNPKSMLLKDLNLLSQKSTLPVIRLLKLHNLTSKGKNERVLIDFLESEEYKNCLKKELRNLSQSSDDSFQKDLKFNLNILYNTEKYWQERFSFKESKGDVFLDFIDVQIPYEFF